MIKYQWKDSLKRKLRQDDPADLATSNWTAMRNSISAGRVDEVLDFMEYQRFTTQGLVGSLTLGRDLLLTRLARFDENEIEKFHRERYFPWVKDWIATTPGNEESLQRFAEQFRTFTDNLVIREEPERYVMTLDPCGTGGKLRRTQKIVSATTRAYPWSWSKNGVCYYCAHCCMFQEILPIEMRGYPICVTQYPDNPNDPCVHLYYKNPELIPDEYFTRIGKTPYRLSKGKG